MREEYLAGRCKLEVVDVHQPPHLAQMAQLVAVPTLIRRAPTRMGDRRTSWR